MGWAAAGQDDYGFRIKVMSGERLIAGFGIICVTLSPLTPSLFDSLSRIKRMAPHVQLSGKNPEGA